MTLTPSQARIITRKTEFSIHFPIARLIAAFPSVTFTRKGLNGGVTYYYEITGPTVWIDKIIHKYSYGV